MSETKHPNEIGMVHRIAHELDWDSRLEGCRIEVEVRDGVVVLKGLVDSPACRTWAEEAARRIPEVLDIANDLEVTPRGAEGRSDAEIAAAVRHALEWDTRIPHERVRSSVTGGVVTLTGELERWTQSRAAEAVVGHLTGVRSVVNEIAVGETVCPRDVHRAVVKALARQAVAEANQLDIGAFRGEIVISGEVSSAREKQILLEAARRVPGVRSVECRVRVREIPVVPIAPC